MPFDPSRLHDPRSYDVSTTDMLSNYSYKVDINYRHPVLGDKTQQITVRSMDVMDEDAILSLATSYARGSGKSGIAGDIMSSQISGAKRSKTLGEL